MTEHQEEERCRVSRQKRQSKSAVHFVWSRSALIETLLEAASATLDARDLARISCANKEAFKARWPWPCPFLRYGDASERINETNATLERVLPSAFGRLADMLEFPTARRSSRRLAQSRRLAHHSLDAWIGRSERSYRSALAISVVAHCSTANRRAVGSTVCVFHCFL